MSNFNVPSTRNNSAFYTLIVEGGQGYETDVGYDKTTRYIVFDLLNTPSISMTTNITSFPLINGDVISDHKYDNPISISLSGKFSLNGKFKDTFLGEESRLLNIQEYFENIRKYGKLCSLVIGGNGVDRYKTRDNLVIKSIRWEPEINTLGFSIDFQEVYFATYSDITIEEDTTDPDQPYLCEFTQLDFTEQVLTNDGIDLMTIQTLNENGLILKGFGEALWDYTKIVLGAYGTAISTAVILTLVIVGGKATTLALVGTSVAFASAFSAVLSATGVGLVIVASLAIIGYGIYRFVKWWKQRKLIKAFKAYSNEVEMTKEYDRYMNLLESVRDSFDELEDYISCYGFSTNNAKQSLYLSIDGDYYNFYVEKQSSSGFWTMKVTKGVNETEVSINGGEKLIGSSSFLECTISDRLFRATHSHSVYLINQAYAYLTQDDDVIKEMLTNEFKANKIDYLGFTTNEIKGNTLNNGEPTDTFKDSMLKRFKEEGVYKDLTKFIVIITTLDPQELNKKMQEQIKICLKRS